MAKKIIANTVVRISADLSDVKTDLKELRRQTRQTSRSFNLFAKAAAGLYVLNQVGRSVISLVEAYDKQIKAETKLLTALKGRKDIQQRLIKQAQELQRVTLYGDEQTIEAQAFLATLIKDEEAIMKLTPLVQDLATKMGGDLRTAADLVAKSVGSSTNALSRYGIVIEGAAGSAERVESAVKALNEQVGGQARAAAEVGAASAQQLSNSWGDFKEEIGSFLAGPGAGLTDWLRDTVEGMTGFLKAFSAAGNSVADNMETVKDKIKQINDEIAKGPDKGRLKELQSELAFWQDLLLVINPSAAGVESPPSITLPKQRQSAPPPTPPGSEVPVSFDTGMGSLLDELTQKYGEYWKTVRTTNEDIASIMADMGDIEDEYAQRVDEATRKRVLARMAERETMRQLLESTAEFTALTVASGVAEKQSARDVAATLIGTLRARAIALVIEKVLAAVPFPFSLLAAPAAAAAASGLFNLIPAFAHGGIAPGGLALVGEQGPELVQMPGGTRIYNHSSTVTMLNRQGAAGEVVFEIAGDKLRGILGRNNRKIEVFG